MRIYRNRLTNTVYSPRLPQVPSPAIARGSFLYDPVAWPPALGLAARAVLSAVYQAALAEAQAACRPLLPERDLLGYWN
jgi:hypothetical protein